MSAVRQFADASAFQPAWERALGEWMDRLQAPEGANLGFVYFSDRYTDDAGNLLATLREETGIAHWVGSVGVGVIGGGEAKIGQPGLSLLVGRFPPEIFHVFSGRTPLRTPGNGEEPYFAVVHGDPHTSDMSDLVADMSTKVSSGFVTGGLSSARGATCQVADDILSGGISGVAFDESVAIATRLTQGCAPFGERYEISEATGIKKYRFIEPIVKEFRTEAYAGISVDELLMLQNTLNKIFVNLSKQN